MRIAESEPCDRLVVQLAALLHDIADSKFHHGDEELAPKIARKFLAAQGLPEDRIGQVLFIIRHISFKNKEEMPENPPIELKVVQDADRLDAMGAIGIARTFNYGGYKNNVMYDPERLPNLAMGKEEYKKSGGTTINHFYEKLLLLKDCMSTEKGKELALERHHFMQLFLAQFYKEWAGG